MVSDRAVPNLVIALPVTLEAATRRVQETLQLRSVVRHLRHRAGVLSAVGNHREARSSRFLGR
jgi:hypothetical protein